MKIHVQCTGGLKKLKLQWCNSVQQTNKKPKKHI